MGFDKTRMHENAIPVLSECSPLALLKGPSQDALVVRWAITRKARGGHGRPPL
ncbi:MAG: hypothetical protein N2645_00795 [Clostridia bacterium]|nr:hypothetical protein [Clostridia bacterium]